jgi:hypothetical protein
MLLNVSGFRSVLIVIAENEIGFIDAECYRRNSVDGGT